eukprot:CAMPEP_0174854798 /NCGR_PEP_ID=MMETSP1114-20130205/31955_1 /TAXON_ID=312471 /ORGANISM="Neobodo designis, Strain CCAP 1951/1" /LENGTH=44 /DNA_ID= /DNA_START= /DNA_END= /DNA_ORIENTATION=
MSVWRTSNAVAGNTGTMNRSDDGRQAAFNTAAARGRNTTDSAAD